MAAAPLVFDDPREDPPIASPELALVDSDLAAQLRVGLSSGGEFRPRPVARTEYPALVFDAVARDLPQERRPLDELDELPDYVVVNADVVAGVVPEYAAPYGTEPADVVSDLDVVPDLGADVPDGHAEASSDYPVLPDLEERSDALEETEAALRRIREQMVAPPAEKRRPRIRRRFTVVSGLCAAAALGVYAADVQLGAAHLPGLIAF